MKRTIKFTDVEGNRATVTVEIQSERNGYLEFSACAEWSGHMGQCRDYIKPKNEEQKAFLTFCEQYHLNGMHAGTPAQEQAIKAHEVKTNKSLDYEARVKFLKSVRKYTVKHEGKPYIYGSSWLHVALPADIEEQTNRLMDKVEEQEKMTRIKDRDLVGAYEKHPQIVFNLFVDTFGGDDEAKIALAVGLNDSLTVREALEITVDGNRVIAQGIDYLAGNDEAMDTAWDEELENYIDDCLLCEIKDEHLKKYFDREAWKADARHDGRGHSLNRYDGGEDCQTVEGEEIYIYRQ